MKKIKVAFYHHNKTFCNVDCRKLELGNPGIGGSEYALLTISKELSKLNNNIEIIVFAQVVNELLPQMNYIQVADLSEAIDTAEQQNIDILVFRYRVYSNKKILDSIKTNLKLVVWCHNFVSRKDLNYFSRNKHVAKLICVGREQLDLYRDHSAFLKSDYIYNAVYTESIYKNVDNIPLYMDRPNWVTYIGCIIPVKGLHYLIKEWPKVIKEYPDAQLHVIGSGQLYNRDTRLGKYGIAEENYENSFINYILEDGEIIPSVKFHGILGSEKNNILRKTKVGNSSGATETFGFTAVEMQINGVRIVSKKCPGSLDTVYHSTGILCSNPAKLSQAIIKQLSEKNNDYSDVLNFIEQNFSMGKIIKNWELLFQEKIWTEEKIHDDTMYINKNYEFKWLKEKLRKWKAHYPILYNILPSYLFIRSVLVCLRLMKPL